MPKTCKKVQKKPRKILHKTMRILSLLRYQYTIKEIAKFTGYSRQVVGYHLGILQELSLIRLDENKLNKYNFYRISQSGQKVLGEYERSRQKELKGIENARWITIIRKPKLVQKFLYENNFKQHQMENWTQWTGNIQGYSISINFGRITKMMITHPPLYANDLNESLNIQSENILTVVSVLNKKWDLELTIPEPVSGRQFTMANGIADHLLDISSGSQIKLMNGKISIDASKHGEPRIEFDQINEAQKFANMPNEFNDFKKTTSEKFSILENQNMVFLDAFKLLTKQNESIITRLDKIAGVDTEKVTPEKNNQESENDYGIYG